jgi:CDP-6-deoxy-D-xylo-4-hexulose-3-dehydrase
VAKIKISQEIREQILSLIGEYYALNWPSLPFIPGETPVPVSGKVFDTEDIVRLVDASLDFWLTTGRYAAEFEREFARFIGVKHCLLTNSGSSANLLAVSALTSPELGKRCLNAGDEVITAATNFPTTINPIIQNRLVPVFLDVHIPTYNADVTHLEETVTEKTKAIFLAHMLGNPFNLEVVTEVARKHRLWLIEDICDAVGAEYQGQKAGTFGDMATVSFYPAHHITMGEGGAVVTNLPQLRKLAISFRDWGRDCWCEPGKDNTCGKRFDWQLGELPHGYDHKYIYSHIGYNLKLTDMQAAVGTAQLKKLPAFLEARQRNFRLLHKGLHDLEEFFILPETLPGAKPSWFGFPLAVRPEAPFTRNQVVRYLESCKIATRLLFGGNIVRQPAYRGIRYRIASDLVNSDFVMNNAFWIGVYPGLSPAMLEYVIEVFHQTPRKLKRREDSVQIL